MLFIQQLVSLHVIERYRNEQTFMTVTFPMISQRNKDLLLKKSRMLSESGFTYFRSGTQWMYVTVRCDDAGASVLALIANDFRPHKYETFGRILSKSYAESRSAVDLVKLYLSVCTTGACVTQENGMFQFRDADASENVQLKELISRFGVQFMIVYNAMLLKKRVVIYHHSAETLAQVMCTLRYLVPHRNPSDYMFPMVEFNSEDFAELKAARFFLASFSDSAVCSRSDFCDVLVNLPAGEIETMPHAKDNLQMTKIHKEIIVNLVQLAERAETTEAQVIDEIVRVNANLLDRLRSLSDGRLQRDDLKRHNLSPNVENFLANLAAAENLI